MVDMVLTTAKVICVAKAAILFNERLWVSEFECANFWKHFAQHSTVYVERRDCGAWMSYTNVTVPEMFDRSRELNESIEMRDLQIKQLNRRIEQYDRILDNIPKAIEEFGYVDLSYDMGRKTIRLVGAKP